MGIARADDRIEGSAQNMSYPHPKGKKAWVETSACVERAVLVTVTHRAVCACVCSIRDTRRTFHYNVSNALDALGSCEEARRVDHGRTRNE